VDDRATGVGSRELILRAAEPADVETLHRFVVELAEAENFPGEVQARPADLAEALFGSRPVAEAILATMDDQAVGFALYYPTYSTILGRTGIHLEDLYISADYRGFGIGRMLLGHLASLARERGCARLEWWVLRTNEPAITFYRRLRARGLDEIEVMRLEGDALETCARYQPGTMAVEGRSPGATSAWSR
jgi:GNAT superfamily N-acetyltransferase